jgi:MoaA/NifB/PqqE/SkfB family radical SAM enzyme
MSISLDYLDERHDWEHGISNLSEHILSEASSLRAAGVNQLFNIVIKSGNYREVDKILC